MEGVILFADDMIFSKGNNFENELFNLLSQEGNCPVIGVNNLDLLETASKSISTYKALIIDWEFIRPTAEDMLLDGAEMPKETPEKFLLEHDIYGLIYVYSNTSFTDRPVAKRLAEKYHDKIKFLQKGSDATLEKKRVLDDIRDFEDKNKQLAFPYIWSQSINQSVQKIFKELEEVDPFWMKEIYDTAKADGGDCNAEVMGVVNTLLSEQLKQDQNFTKAISGFSSLEIDFTKDREDTLAKLYNKLYYTKISNVDVPISTGDIFQISETEAAIVITPECQISHKKDVYLDCLLVKKETTQHYFKGELDEQGKFRSLKQKRKLAEQIFHQNAGDKYHFFISFPFSQNDYNLAVVDFNYSLDLISKDRFSSCERLYRLNSPYIHQLRQRYLSFTGKYGVPAIPKSLQNYALTQFEECN